MLKNLSLFLPLFFLLHALYAQVAVINTPAWVDEIAYTEGNIQIEKVSGGQAYLLVDRQYNVETEEIYVHYSYEILSEAGLQSGSVIEVNFDPVYQQLSFVGIDVVREKKRHSHLNPANFQIIQKEANAERFIYDGEKTAILHLSDIRVGDIVDYKFILKGRNPVFKGKFYASIYFNYQDPTGRNYLKIQTAADRKLRIKNFNTDLEPTIESGNSKTYRWDLKDVDGLVSDSYTPSWYDPYARIEVSEYENWAQLGQWALPLYKISQKDLQEIKQKASQIKKEHKKTEDQIKEALKFVQNEVRYLGFESGLNGFAPHAPSKVIRQRFGDCKDKSLLLVTLLKELGLAAYPALVHTSTGKALPEQLASPGAFNHCIVKVDFNDKSYWYDPTISNQGGEFSSTYFPDYKYALVIKEGTEGLEAIPYSPRSKVEARETFTVKDFDEPVTLEVTTRYKGKEADNQRQYFLNNSLPQVQKSYLNFYADLYPKIKFTNDLRYEDDPTFNMFTVYEAYEIEDFWFPVEENNPGTIKCEVYPQLVRDLLIDPGNIERKSPLYLYYPKNVDQIIEFYLPEHWNIESASNNIKGPGIEYTSFVNSIDNKVTLNYTLETLKDDLKVEEVDEYVEKVKKIKADLGYVLTYNKDLVLAADDSNNNWFLIVLSMIALAVFAFVARKVYYDYDPFSPNTRIAYESIGGWLFLAGFGILISPIAILIGIFMQGYFNQEMWLSITESSSLNFDPLFAFLLALELLINIALFVFSCLLTVLFVKRRSSFPRLVIIFYVFNFLFLTVDTFVFGSLNVIATSDLADSYKDIARSFISMLIWVPYFLMSERVKETFVHTIKDYEAETVLAEEGNTNTGVLVG